MEHFPSDTAKSHKIGGGIFGIMVSGRTIRSFLNREH